MYQVYADDLLIYDDTRAETTLKLINPKLSLSDSAAGSFTMTVPPGNPGYYTIQRMTTTIRVIKEGTQLWEGRLLQESVDFQNQRRLTCEGELAYLNDVTLPQQTFSYSSGNKVKSLLEAVIAIYNSKADVNRQFTVGTVNVTPMEIYASTPPAFERTSNYETVIEFINTQLVGKLGGHLRVRHETVNDADVRYLDYIEEGMNVNSQIIRFGKNLIDFTRSFDATEYATAIIPLGAKLDGEDIPSGESKVGDLTYYLTVKSAPDDSSGHTSSQPYHAANSIYIVIDEAVANYGRIEKVVHFDDVTDATALATLGEYYLTDTQFDTMVIELTAFDLHYLNPEMEMVKIGDKIRVISEPHGLNREFPVTKLEIPLDQPENTQFTLGDEIKMSLTATNNKINNEVKKKLESDLDIDLSGIEDTILAQVEDDVDDLMNERLNGYITITSGTDSGGTYSEALYISDRKPFDPANPGSAKYWRWNINGLGYNDGSGWKTAMTMDGTILGDRIAAGTVHASKLSAGSLSLVTTAGTNSCDIKLKTNGISASDLEIGNISTSSGEDTNSNYYIRTVSKVYLNYGDKINVSTSGTTCSYRVYRYSSETTYYGSSSIYSEGSAYTCPASAYYRITIEKSNGTTFSLSELPSFAARIELGSVTEISSATIQINGMVKFTDLSTEGSTVINGANITTGYISADRIDLTSLKVNTIYNHYNDVVFETSGTQGSGRGLVNIGWSRDSYQEWDSSTGANRIITIWGSKIDLLSVYQTNNSNLRIDLQNATIFPMNLSNSSDPQWYIGNAANYFERIYSNQIWFGNSGCALYILSGELWFRDSNGYGHQVLTD